MPPDRRLRCPFPLCPVTFKGQNGRTHHIRAMHTNSNIQEHANPEGPNQAPTRSEGGNDGYSANLADRQGLVARAARRIEHPHLTGMCLLHVLFTVYQTYQ